LISTFEGTGSVIIAPVPNVFQNLVSLITGAMPKAK
jgi:hypothetical protein